MKVDAEKIVSAWREYLPLHCPDFARQPIQATFDLPLNHIQL